MINSKIILVFAGFAVLVSLIASGIRGVPILEIIFRTVTWAIIFAVIGVGISVVVNRFFPELGRLLNGENIEEKKYTGQFEAVIPEENPHDFMNQDSMFSDLKEDTKVDLGPKGNSLDLEELGSADITGMESTGAESTGVKNTGVNQTSDEIAGDQPLETVENMANVPYIDAITENEQIQEGDIDNVDSLPEIDSFSSSFTPFSDGISPVDSDSSETKGMYSKPKTNLDVHGFIEDPLKTARAIHTWIERDKEG